MKTKTFKLAQILLVLFLCQNAYLQVPSNENTFIEFSIAGKDFNDTMSIRGVKGDHSVMVSALVGKDEHNDGLLTKMEYYDQNQKMSATIRIPGEKTIIECKEGNPKFSISFSIDGKHLIAESMSINIQKFKQDRIIKITPRFTRGSFEGIMVHKYFKDDEEIRETYSVSGIFQYASDLYKPKK